MPTPSWIQELALQPLGGAQPRRQFFRILSGLALGAASTGLFGCAGGIDPGPGDGDEGDGGGVGDGGGGGSGLLTAEDMAAAIESVSGYAATLNPVSDDDLRSSVLAHIRSREEFLASGLNDDGVWAVMQNGAPYVFITNRWPLPGEAEGNPSVAALGETNVPDDTVIARLVNAMGPMFTNEPAALEPAVRRFGYTVSSGNATLEGLQNLRKPAFFYISAHGTVVQIPQLDGNGKMILDANGDPQMVDDYGISTTSLANNQTIAAQKAACEAGLLAAGTMAEDRVNGSTVYANRFIVTSRWVNQYWQFAKDSLVWISACSSMGRGSAPFANACIAKGAGLYVGWSDTTYGPAALAAAKFVVDRLLGANLLDPKEKPPQRSFTYDKVFADMRSRGIGTTPVLSQVTGSPIPGRTADLRYLAAPNSTFGLLAPSIQRLLIDEYQETLHLFGIFGNPPENERAVIVDGVELQIVKWTESEVVCRIPRSGQGSKGEVKVTVRGHDSNVRRITSWNIEMTYRYEAKERPGLVLTGPFFLRFRGDIGEYRTAPGKPPVKPVMSFAATADSLGILEASGTIRDGDCTTTWTGRTEFPPMTWQGDDQETVVGAVLKIDTKTMTGALGVVLGGYQPAFFTETVQCSEGTQSAQFAPFQSILEDPEVFTIEYPDGTQFQPTLPAMKFSLTSNFSVPAHKFIDVALNELVYSWPAATAEWPPDPAAAREF